MTTHDRSLASVDASGVQLPAGDYVSRADKTTGRVLGVLLLLLFGVPALMVFIGSLGMLSCQNLVVSEVLSADGRLKVDLFKRECDGEPTEGGIALLERMTFGFRGPGNLLRFPGSEIGQVSVSWEGRKTIVIRHPATLPVGFRMQSFWILSTRVTVREELD